MGQCNYCGFKTMKIEAKKRGKVIKKLPATWGLGGWELFMVPKNISINDIRSWIGPSEELPNGDKNWEEYSCGWMMEIPDRCYC